jgi:protein TonB
MIARDHGAVALAAAAGSGSPPQGIAWRWGPWALPRRSLVLIVIVVLHGALILGLANGLARVVAGVVDPHTTATVIERPTPLDHPVPVPEPTLGPHTIPEVPIPDYPLAGSDDPDGGLSAPRAAQPTAPAEGSASIVHRVAGGPARGFPRTQDYYPPAAIRAEEQGGATVNVCVDAAGRLTGAPSLVQSSGSTRLDEGALRLAQAGSGHYRPTTEDGRPVSACYPFRITFTLNP